MKKYKITLTYETTAACLRDAAEDAYNVAQSIDFQYVEDPLLTISDGQESRTYDPESGYEVKNA